MQSDVDMKWQDAFDQVSIEMNKEFQSKGDLGGTTLHAWEMRMKEYKSDENDALATSQVHKFLSDPCHTDYRQKVEANWADFINEIEKDCMRKLDNLFEMLQTDRAEEEKLSLYFEKELRERILDEKTRNSMAKNPHLLEEEFKNLFDDGTGIVHIVSRMTRH